MLRQGWRRPLPGYLVHSRAVHQSHEWNNTSQLKKVPKPKDYALDLYKQVKGHYDEFTGMPMIEAAQQKVFTVQQSLIDEQNKKAPIKLELQRLRQQLQDLNHSLQMCKKQDANYLSIMRQIVELNQKELDEQEHFDMVEEHVRVLFSDLMLAVQKSYELERNQTTHFKNFSWIFSIVCGGLTFSAFLFKYLTQTGEFKAMQKTMGLNEGHRRETEEKFLSEFQSIRLLLIDQNRTLDRITQENKNTKKQKESQHSSTLYDWVVWACRPLKFW